MSRPSPASRLSTSSLLLAVPLLASCAALGQMISKPPTMELRVWRLETVLVEPGHDTLGLPSVFADASGQPQVVLPDRAFYMATKSIALGRRTETGWRVELPAANPSVQVCGRSEGERVAITRRELEGQPRAFFWNGVTTEEGATPDPCPIEDGNERSLQGSVAHQIELSKDGRTLWHDLPGGGTPCPPHDSTPETTIQAFAVALDDGGRVHAALFERKEGDAPGHLRHAVCKDGEWTSSMIAEGVQVTQVGMAVIGEQPHVAYVDQRSDAVALIHATPAEGESPPGFDADGRVLPAIEACARLWDAPPAGEGVEGYQSGDGLRCAVLERDPQTGEQALAVLGERCDGGDVRACALAGSLHHWLMGVVAVELEIPTAGGTEFHTEWRGLRVSGVPEDKHKAAARYGQACDGGDLRACAYQAVLLPTGDERRERAKKACEGGLPAGCALAVVAAAMKPKPPLAKQAGAVLGKACDEGDRVSCNDLGVLRHGQGDAAGARTALDGACKAGLPRACDNLERASVP
ncbi:MAG: sel1 repeat family protein [Myxococcales bacterium]|nr:sel1 repeat family protein [Myxococcales bacterium]